MFLFFLVLVLKSSLNDQSRLLPSRSCNEAMFSHRPWVPQSGRRSTRSDECFLGSPGSRMLKDRRFDESNPLLGWKVSNLFLRKPTPWERSLRSWRRRLTKPWIMRWLRTTRWWNRWSFDRWGHWSRAIKTMWCTIILITNNTIDKRKHDEELHGPYLIWLFHIISSFCRHNHWFPLFGAYPWRGGWFKTVQTAHATPGTCSPTRGRRRGAEILHLEVSSFSVSHQQTLLQIINRWKTSKTRVKNCWEKRPHYSHCTRLKIFFRDITLCRSKVWLWVGLQAPLGAFGQPQRRCRRWRGPRGRSWSSGFGFGGDGERLVCLGLDGLNMCMIFYVSQVWFRYVIVFSRVF